MHGFGSALINFANYLGYEILMLLSLIEIISAYYIGRYILLKTRSHFVITRNLAGKVAIVTGANRGIGKELCINLAKRHAKVILACRDVLKGQKAVEEIREKSKNPNVACSQLDLCSFKSIRKFVEDFKSSEKSLDILVNNAGINPPSTLQYTEDGFEVTIQTNYLGHFLLTCLLMDRLKTTTESRIVMMSSYIAYCGVLNPTKFHIVEPYIPFLTFCTSKAMMNLFTIELARRFPKNSVIINSCHPGYVKGYKLDCLMSLNRIVNFHLNFFGHTLEDAVSTPAFLAGCCVMKGKTGKFYSECVEGCLPPWCRDLYRARQLFEASIKAVNLTQKEIDVLTGCSQDK